MVKANAYGHGDLEIAKHLEGIGIQTMGVSLIEEGILLREAGILSEILVFGIFDQEGAQAIVRHRLTPVLSIWSQIYDLEKVLTSQIKVHLKFDTGMHRLGFLPMEAVKLQSHFQDSKKLKLGGVLTHLHSAEDASDFAGKSFSQLKQFKTICDHFLYFNPVFHSLNSAGLLNFSKHQGQVLPFSIPAAQGARPGLALYGLTPVPGFTQFKPVMSIRSQVVRYHQLSIGQTVSYGGTWRAQRESVIGVVPIGYADGYHRTLSNKSEVLFAGKKVSQVGNICMDFFMIDVTDVVKDKALSSFQNQEVTLFGYDREGNQLGAEDLAKRAGTISWEILTSVGERVPRIFERAEVHA